MPSPSRTNAARRRSTYTLSKSQNVLTILCYVYKLQKILETRAVPVDVTDVSQIANENARMWISTQLGGHPGMIESRQTSSSVLLLSSHAILAHDLTSERGSLHYKPLPMFLLGHSDEPGMSCVATPSCTITQRLRYQDTIRFMHGRPNKVSPRQQNPAEN